MSTDANTMISNTEPHQNFSQNLSSEENCSNKGKEIIADNEDVSAISERLIKQNMEAYEVLAK